MAMTTMKQIAKETGVSVSTVSLVLNGRDVGRIRPQIASLVRGTAKRLGYRPNPLASSLRTSRTRIIGFISEEIATTPFAGGIILGAQDAASMHDYVMLTVNTDGLSNETDEIAALQRYGVDGFIYAKMWNRMTEVPAGLQDYPTVLVDAQDLHGTVPSITPNEFRIGHDATTRLIDAGCTRIAYVGTDNVTMPAQIGRRAGYLQAIKDANITAHDDLDIAVGNNQSALDKVFALISTQHPDGVFCFNDARTWHVYESAARLGLSIGKDIRVVGVDNHRLVAETLAPQLTTIELPHYEMGYWGVCKLLSLIDPHTKPLIQPQDRATLPPLNGPVQSMIHCRLIEKDSVRARS